MKYCIQHLVWIFTHFMLLASFLAPKSIRKSKIFWCFQGVQKDTTNIKRVNYSRPPVWLCTVHLRERQLSLKGRISKRVLEENKARQVFRKTNFYETMSKICSFFLKTWRAFFLVAPFLIFALFALLQTNAGFVEGSATNFIAKDFLVILTWTRTLML